MWRLYEWPEVATLNKSGEYLAIVLIDSVQDSGSRFSWGVAAEVIYKHYVRDKKVNFFLLIMPVASRGKTTNGGNGTKLFASP